MTHMVISAIVYAETEEQAFERAKEIFQDLVEHSIFDYYATFDENLPMVGKNRWGNFPAIARANSKEGKTLIQDCWRATKRDFMEHIKIVRPVFKTFTDEEVLNENCEDKTKLIALKLKNGEDLLRNLHMVRHYLRKLGEYIGTSIWLYSDDGEGIRSKEQLNNVLNKYKCYYEDRGEPNPNKDNIVWVVPADVHY